MLSEIIKKKIEEKSGISIRYSRDCDTLSEKISAECKCRISASTLRRLFGFNKSVKEPRLLTLDILSNYLGFATWEDLLKSISGEKDIQLRTISELKPGKLKIGEQFQYSYSPDTVVHIEYVGKSKFKVISQKNSQLKEGDIFKASVLALHHPIFILEVERVGEKPGKIIEARVSGITSIERI